MTVTAYTIPELEPILRMKTKAIRRLIGSRKLVARRVRRQYLVTEDELRRFLEMPRKPPVRTPEAIPTYR